MHLDGDPGGTGLLRLIRVFIGTPLRVMVSVFRFLLFWWLRRRFRISIVYRDGSEALRPPFVVLANHVNFWDPFFVTMPFRKQVRFIAADGNFRTRVMRLLMAIGGTIPKAKARNDLESIRTLQHLVRDRKIVGIFPEGQRSWDGTSKAVLPGTPKLARLLKVPVVSVRLKGGYLSMPRWSPFVHRGKLEIEVSITVNTEEVHSLSRSEITEKVNRSVDHDETKWQQTEGGIFIHPRRAEHLESVLFYCPDCHRWGTLSSVGSKAVCSSCGFTTWMAPSGRLYRVVSDGDGANVPRMQRHPYPSVAAWNGLQREELRRHVETLIDDRDQPFVSDSRPIEDTTASPVPYTIAEAELLTGHRSRPLYRHGVTGITITSRDVILAPVHIKTSAFLYPGFRPDDDAGRQQHPPIVMPIPEISGVHVQYSRQLEFYWRQRLYVVRMLRPQDSAYRVEETILAIQEKR